MPVVERIEVILPVGSEGADAGRQHAAAGAQQFAVVAFGQDLIAEKEDESAPLLEIGFQQAGFAGGELPDVGQKDAVVIGQIAFDQPAFGNDLGLDQRAGVGFALVGIQGQGQIIGRARQSAAGRFAIDAQDAELIFDLQHQPAVVVDVEGVGGQANFGDVLAGRFEAIVERDRRLLAGCEIDIGFADAMPIDQQFDQLVVARPGGERLQLGRRRRLRGRRRPAVRTWPDG